MGPDQKLKVDGIARKLYVLSRLFESRRVEVTTRTRDEKINWALSDLLQEISQEILSLNIYLSVETQNQPFEFERVDEL